MLIQHKEAAHACKHPFEVANVDKVGHYRSYKI